MKETDLRRYARNTHLRLVAGGIIVVLVVGNLLVLLFYGKFAAAQSLLCMGIFLFPVLLIVVILQVMEWIVSRERDG